MENSLGVGNPQTVFLSKASSVRTPIGKGRMFGCLRIDVPQEVLSNVRRYRKRSDNGSRPLLLQRPSNTTDFL
jgi:hypothetical protein